MGDAARRTEQAIDRVVPVLRWLSRAATRLALTALTAGAVVWWALRQGLDEGQGFLVVTAVILLLPPALLGLFVVAVRTLISLPQRMREVPGAMRERAGDIRRRAGDVVEARRTGRGRTILAALRLVRSVASSRELLEILPAGAVLLTPGMLVATVVATVAALFEAALGVLALIWLGVA